MLSIVFLVLAGVIALVRLKANALASAARAASFAAAVTASSACLMLPQMTA